LTNLNFLFEYSVCGGKILLFYFLALDIEDWQKNKCVKCAVGSFWYETQRYKNNVTF